MKKIYKCSVCGDIHIGISAPELCPTCHQKSSYQESNNPSLADFGEKKLWRCIVCNDLHVGIGWPKICPTCQTADAYVQINEQEFKILLNGLTK
jgi:rubrerythrin